MSSYNNNGEMCKVAVKIVIFSSAYKFILENSSKSPRNSLLTLARSITLLTRKENSIQKALSCRLFFRFRVNTRREICVHAHSQTINHSLFLFSSFWINSGRKTERDPIQFDLLKSLAFTLWLQWKINVHIYSWNLSWVLEEKKEGKLC